MEKSIKKLLLLRERWFYHVVSSDLLLATTSRERHKSTSYQRLKNSKRTIKMAKEPKSVRYPITVPENPKNGTNWRAGGSFVAKHQKNEEGTLWRKQNFRKKSFTMPKQTERGDTLISPGIVCRAEKKGKPFWFSSLGQIVQFES